MGPPTAPVYDWYQNWVKRLQGDADDDAGKSVVSVFDSLLTQLNNVPAVVNATVAISGAQDTLKRLKILSEIERQLFLQFLEKELTFLRGHRIMKAIDLYRRMSHDQQICQQKQSQITQALIRIFNVQGIDASFSAALNAQRFETLKTYVAMKLEPAEVTAMMNVDDFLNNRETGAVRRIMQQLLDAYGEDSTSDFDAHDAWIDLKQRWEGWASKHGERMKAFKNYWEATGGKRDIESNTAALKVFSDYYKELYEQIESDNYFRAMAKMINFDPWNK